MFKLSISSRDLEGDRLAQLTQDFRDLLHSEVGVPADLEEGETGKEGKGEPITIGVIVIALIKSGAVASFFSALKAYFENRENINLTLQNASGDKLTISGQNLNARNTEEAIKKFLGREAE